MCRLERECNQICQYVCKANESRNGMLKVYFRNTMYGSKAQTITSIKTLK
jgi:hypothetical protein